MPYQPVQQIDVPQLFATMANLRSAKLNQQQGELQLADLYEARDRRKQIQAALQAGDMNAYAALDPHGYAAMQKAGLDAQKTQSEIINTRSQVDERQRNAVKDVDENTNKVQQFVSKALEANPQSAPQWQRHVDDLAANGKINHFQLPGFQQSPELAGPSMQPNRQEVRTMQAGAGVESPWDKPTIDMIEFAKAYPNVDINTPEGGELFHQYQLEMKQTSSGNSADNRAMNLRKEFTSLQTVKNYQVLNESFEKMKVTSPNGPGDIGLIFNYMKMLDPNSAVREGEYASAENSGGIAQSISNLYNKALKGNRLSADTRKSIMSEADKLVVAERKRYDLARRQYTTLATKYKIDPNDVVMSEDEVVDPNTPAPGNANTHVIGFEGPGADARDIEFNPNSAQPQPAAPQRPAQPQRRAAPVGRAQAVDEFNQAMGIK